MKRLLPLVLLLTTPTPLLAAPEDVHAMPATGTRLDIVATGTVHRVPDVATIGAGVVTQAAQAGTALADNARRMTATIAALRRAGVADRDIQTASIGLSPQYRYVDNQPPVLNGYQASNQLTVRLRDLAGAGKVLDALVAAGANQLNGPNLSIDRPEAALDEARGQALATARARAELYARAAGLRVARIVRITESADASAPIRPMMMMARAKTADTPIESGEQELSVSLSVTFELS